MDRGQIEHRSDIHYTLDDPTNRPFYIMDPTVLTQQATDPQQQLENIQVGVTSLMRARDIMESTKAFQDAHDRGLPYYRRIAISWVCTYPPPTDLEHTA